MKADLNSLTDEEITRNFRESVNRAIADSRKKGLPVCGFDTETMQSYILYPDGRKEYAEAWDFRTSTQESSAIRAKQSAKAIYAKRFLVSDI